MFKPKRFSKKSENKKDLDDLVKRNEAWIARKEKKLASIGDENARKQLDQCTFQPTLVAESPVAQPKKMAASNKRHEVAADSYMRRQMLAREEKKRKEECINNPLNYRAVSSIAKSRPPKPTSAKDEKPRVWKEIMRSEKRTEEGPGKLDGRNGVFWSQVMREQEEYDPEQEMHGGYFDGRGYQEYEGLRNKWEREIAEENEDVEEEPEELGIRPINAL